MVVLHRFLDGREVLTAPRIVHADPAKPLAVLLAKRPHQTEKATNTMKVVLGVEQRLNRRLITTRIDLPQSD
jgi:hypothetical protein